MRLIGLVALSIAPAAAQLAPVSPVEQAPLARSVFEIGVLDRSSGAVDSAFWRGAVASSLGTLLDHAPTRPASPAIGSAMRRALLSPAEEPPDATPSLGGKKLKALVAAGFLDEARTIESLAVASQNDPGADEAIATANLLFGDLDAACLVARRMVGAAASAPFWIKVRMLCYAAANELDAAELALGLLTEGGAVDDDERPLFGALVAGARQKREFEPHDAVQYAAVKLIGASIGPSTIRSADGGVVMAIAHDKGLDWPIRLAAGRRSALMGVMTPDDLRALYGASGDASPAYQAIRSMQEPDRIRDKIAAIASEINGATSLEELNAVALLYSDDLRSFEGAIIAPVQAQSFALASLAMGDSIGAERWLIAAGPIVSSGALDEQKMRFIENLAILAELDPQAAERIAARFEVAITKKAQLNDSYKPPSPNLASVVAASIDAAKRGSAAELALAALAASSPAADGDPIAEAVREHAFAAAGMDETLRRLAVERSLSAIFPVSQDSSSTSNAIEPDNPKTPPIAPRLKPRRAA